MEGKCYAAVAGKQTGVNWSMLELHEVEFEDDIFINTLIYVKGEVV